MLPWALVAGDPKVGYRETGEAGLRFGSAARRAFIADFAARAGRRSWERRDGRRMVVSLHLHEDVDRLDATAINMRVRVGEVACSNATLDDGGVVPIGGKDPT